MTPWTRKKKKLICTLHQCKDKKSAQSIRKSLLSSFSCNLMFSRLPPRRSRSHNDYVVAFN